MSASNTFLRFKIILISYIVSAFCWSNPCNESPLKETLSCDISKSFSDRAYDLIYNQERHLSNYLDIYQGLSGNGAKSVSELNIPSYQWWNAALHGMGNGHGINYNGPIKHSTMFPQVIHTGSTFNSSLFAMIGEAVSTEARAMYNNQQSGLTFYSPSVDIFTDPRWGRGQETLGEDPFLISVYAKQLISAMQDNGNKYLKTSVCGKHFADYTLENAGNGINRKNFDAIVSKYDQNDTYLVPFKYAVIDGNASCIYCSYVEENGVPSCTNYELLTNIVRKEWNFYGYIISECGGVESIETEQHYTNTTGQTIFAVFNAGMDLNCGTFTQKYIKSAVESKDVSLSMIQNAIYRTTLTQFRLGMFDAQSSNPWHQLGPNDVCTDKHFNLSLDTAHQGIVLLKNAKNALPLNRAINSIALIGPNAENVNVMKGDYAGNPPFIYSVKDGISMDIDGGSSKINYVKGCDIDSNDISDIEAAVNAAKSSDISILVMGLDESQESEGKDRRSLLLPGQQNNLIKQVCDSAKGDVILVIISGGCVDISQWKLSNNINAILWAGYPGMFGGKAIADVIFGIFNPTGLLTQTWYFQNYTEEMKQTDMNMRANKTTGSIGRGYRYFDGEVIYPFGYGLSYTLFECSNVVIEDKNTLRTNITNIGKRSGGGVVLIYFVPNNAGKNGVELKRLVGFGRVNLLLPNKSHIIEMDIYKEFANSKQHQNMNGKYVIGGVCT